MTTSLITRKQMKRLHTLWGQFCRQANLDAKDRVARLDWTAGAIGRQIASFRELRADEANTAMNVLVRHLPPELYEGKRPARRLAHAYGTAGRRGRVEKEVRLADVATLQLLSQLVAQLGWTRERLDGFLHSKKSPVRSGAIRTLAEANRVIWCMRTFLRRGKRSTIKSGPTPDLGGNDAGGTLQRAG